MLGAVWRDRELTWRAVLLFAVGTALLGDVVMIVGIWAKHALFSDFAVFWTAARVDPSQVYDVAKLTHAQSGLIGPASGARPFAYPPSFLPWLRPFGAMPYDVGLVAWTASGLGLYVAAGAMIARPAELAFALLSPMLFLVLAAGQATLFIAALLTAGLAMVRTRPLAAGILIGLAATLKPQAVALAPLALIAGRHWRSLAAAAATGLLVGVVCVVLQGPQLWQTWLAASVQFLRLARALGYVGIGVTPSALAAQLKLEDWATYCVIAAGAALGLACVWTVFRRTETPVPRLAALVAGCLLCAPYALDYELAALAPAAAVMLLDRGASRSSWLAAALAFTGGAGPASVIVLAVSLIWEQRRRGPLPNGRAEARAAASGAAPSTAASAS